MTNLLLLQLLRPVMDDTSIHVVPELKHEPFSKAHHRTELSFARVQTDGGCWPARTPDRAVVDNHNVRLGFVL